MENNQYLNVSVFLYPPFFSATYVVMIFLPFTRMNLNDSEFKSDHSCLKQRLNCFLNLTNDFNRTLKTFSKIKSQVEKGINKS